MSYAEIFEPVNFSLCRIMYGSESWTDGQPMLDSARILIKLSYEFDYGERNIPINAAIMMGTLEALKNKPGIIYKECAENIACYIDENSDVNKMCALLTWGIQNYLLDTTTSPIDRGPLVQHYHAIMLGLFSPHKPSLIGGINPRSYARYAGLFRRTLPEAALIRNYVNDALTAFDDFPPAARLAITGFYRSISF